MTKFICFIIIIGIFSHSFSHSQITFEKVIDEGYSELGNCISICKDKGYIISGRNYYFSQPYHDYMYLVKVDSIGNTSWKKNISGGTFGYSVLQSYDNGYVILGKVGGANVTVVVKTDTVGNNIWSKSFCNSVGYSIVQTADSNYMISGYVPIVSGNRDVYLHKINSQGDSLWTKKYGDMGFDIAYDIKQTNDNGFIIVGESQIGAGGPYKLYIIKTNSNGDTLWTRRYNEGVKATSVYQTQDSGYIVTGFLYGIMLMKIDCYGNVEWSIPLNGFESYSVLETSDNGYFVAGYKGNYLYIVKTDSMGMTLWEKKFLNGYESKAKSSIQATDNGFAIAGYSFGEIGGQDMYLIKTDENGCVKPMIKQISGPINVTVNDTIEFSTATTFRTDSTMLYWYSNNGVIVNGENNDIVKVIWNQVGIDTLMIVASNSCGSDTLRMNINVLDCVNPLISTIYGDSIVGLFAPENYHVDLIEGTSPINYFWAITHGNILSGQYSNQVTVEWTELGIAMIQVTATNSCGTDSSIVIHSIYVSSLTELRDDKTNIYPNPSNDGIFSITLNNKLNNIYKISVFDINGQLIYEDNCTSNSHRIDLSEKPKGVYLLNIQSENKYLIGKLIIL